MAVQQAHNRFTIELVQVLSITRQIKKIYSAVIAAFVGLKIEVNMDNQLTCPVCGSNETDSTWVDNAICGEYESAECLECGEEWNECARDYHNEDQQELF